MEDYCEVCFRLFEEEECCGGKETFISTVEKLVCQNEEVEGTEKKAFAAGRAALFVMVHAEAWLAAKKGYSHNLNSFNNAISSTMVRLATKLRDKYEMHHAADAFDRIRLFRENEEELSSDDLDIFTSFEEFHERVWVEEMEICV